MIFGVGGELKLNIHQPDQPGDFPRMTGRNSHNVGAGQITEAAAGFPGYTGTIPKSAATMAKVEWIYTPPRCGP